MRDLFVSFRSFVAIPVPLQIVASCSRSSLLTCLFPSELNGVHQLLLIRFLFSNKNKCNSKLSFITLFMKQRSFSNWPFLITARFCSYSSGTLGYYTLVPLAVLPGTAPDPTNTSLMCPVTGKNWQHPSLLIQYLFPHCRDKILRLYPRLAFESLVVV